MLVIVIIAILSLIAVPNFLEAQVRAKVARVNSDTRAIAAAIHQYQVDNNSLPLDPVEGQVLLAWGEDEKDRAYVAMTTPIAYITKPPVDPFSYEDYFKCPVYRTTTRIAALAHGDPGFVGGCPQALANGYYWVLRSRGPGGTKETDFRPRRADAPEVIGAGEKDILHSYVYDPTNGVTSKGWILRTNAGIYPTRSVD